MTEFMETVISVSLAFLAALFIGTLITWGTIASNDRYDRLRKDCLDRGFAFVPHGPTIEQADCFPPGTRP